MRIGVLRPHRVEDVLRAQRAGYTRKFGEIAIELGCIHEEVLRGYVEAKVA